MHNEKKEEKEEEEADGEAISEYVGGVNSPWREALPVWRPMAF